MRPERLSIGIIKTRRACHAASYDLLANCARSKLRKFAYCVRSFPLHLAVIVCRVGVKGPARRVPATRKNRVSKAH